MNATSSISAVTSVSRFVDVSRRYCDLIEQAEPPTAPLLFQAAELILLELYVAALGLPNPEPTADELRGARISHEEWLVVFRRLQRTFGPYDFYREIYDPAALGDPDGAIDTGDEPVVSSLADDLADIWRDLRSGLLVWNDAADDIRSDLVSEWREAFVSHWGQHLVDGLRAIHWWIHVHHIGRSIDAPEA
jgi:hypothetical protein